MESDRPIVLRQVRNVPEILNVTLDFLRLAGRGLFRSLFLIALPPILVASVFFVQRLINAIKNIDSGYNVISEISSLAPFTLIASIVSSIGGALLVGIVHSYVQLYDETGDVDFSVGEVWAKTREFFWMLLFTNIGLAICGTIAYVMSAFIPFAGPLAFLALLSFGVLYYPYRIYHRRGFFQSFILSARLVQGKWPSTFGLVMLLYLLSTVMTSLFFVLPMVIAAILQAVGTIDFESWFVTSDWAGLIIAAVGSIYFAASILFTAVPLLCMIFLFHSQRERKDAVALQEELELIGQPIE